jgi:hypothetical protein
MTVLSAGPLLEPSHGSKLLPRRAFVTAGLMVLAAGIHLFVIPEHLREWWMAAVFFLVVANGQAGLAAMLFRKLQPLTVSLGIWANLAVVGVYVWSRTTGLPFGPEHHAEIASGHAGHLPVAGGVGNGIPVLPQPNVGRAESVGALDISALAIELVAVAILVSLLPERTRGRTTNAMLACGVVLWISWAAGAWP